MQPDRYAILARSDREHPIGTSIALPMHRCPRHEFQHPQPHQTGQDPLKPNNLKISRVAHP
jgi:hypothetical protein